MKAESIFPYSKVLRTHKGKINMYSYIVLPEETDFKTTHFTAWWVWLVLCVNTEGAWG